MSVCTHIHIHTLTLVRAPFFLESLTGQESGFTSNIHTRKHQYCFLCLFTEPTQRHTDFKHPACPLLINSASKACFREHHILWGSWEKGSLFHLHRLYMYWTITGLCWAGGGSRRHDEVKVYPKYSFRRVEVLQNLVAEPLGTWIRKTVFIKPFA